MRPGETPVPVPNTKVKTRTADGTMLVTVWESRRVPTKNFRTLKTAYENIRLYNEEKHRARIWKERTAGLPGGPRMTETGSGDSKSIRERVKTKFSRVHG